MRARAVYLVSGGSAWVAAFVALLVLLPPRPMLRFERPGTLLAAGFTADGTLVVTSSIDSGSAHYSVVPAPPLYLLDPQSGTSRRIDLSDDVQEGGAGDQTSGAEYRNNVSLSGVDFVADEVVTRHVPEPGNLRVQVWNTRTGEERVRFDQERREAGVLGEQIWTRPIGRPQPETRYELRDIATGRLNPTDLRVSQVDLATCPRSGDGRYVVTGARKELRLLDLETGAERNIQPADGFAFSVSSSWLATISSGEAGASPVCRVYELNTGALVAERALPGGEGRFLFRNRIGFLDGDLTIGVPQSLMGKGESSMPRYDRIDSWRWQSDEIHSIGRNNPSNVVLCPEEVPVSSRWQDTYAVPHVVRIGPYLFDVAKGQRLGSLRKDSTHPIVSASGEWCVVRSTARSLRSVVADVVGVVSTGLAKAIRTEGMRRLEHLPTNRVAVWLEGAQGETVFSPDGRWLLSSHGTRERTVLDIWELPPSYPYWRVLMWSLIVPGLLVIKRRRDLASRTSSRSGLARENSSAPPLPVPNSRSADSELIPRNPT